MKYWLLALMVAVAAHAESIPDKERKFNEKKSDQLRKLLRKQQTLIDSWGCKERGMELRKLGEEWGCVTIPPPPVKAEVPKEEK